MYVDVFMNVQIIRMYKFELDTVNCLNKYLVVFWYEFWLLLCSLISPEFEELHYNTIKHKAAQPILEYVVSSQKGYLSGMFVILHN